MSRTWYNEERNMWEMDPIAVPYAVSKKLIQSARIRHDWAAMYITLKGDEREYYVDVKVVIYPVFQNSFLFQSMKSSTKSLNMPMLVFTSTVSLQEFEMLFEDFGGFDGLYLRMLAYGVPTVVQLMWIPFSELDFGQQFLLVMRLCHQCLTGLWNTTVVSRARGWIIDKIRNINDDLMMMIVFPTVEFIIPYSVLSYAVHLFTIIK